MVLDIVVDDALADIVVGRFDAGIRVGGRLEKDMVAVRLTPDLNMVAVASPDYLARRAYPSHPASCMTTGVIPNAVLAAYRASRC